MQIIMKTCVKTVLFIAAVVASSRLFAALPATNVWTGAGNDYNWSNMSNWENAAGGDPVACDVGCVWDLTAFPAGGTLVNDFAGNLIVNGLVFAGNMGTVTLTNKTNSCLFRFPDGRNSADDHAWITVPSGTTVNFTLRHTDEWKQWYTHIRGGGTFKVNGYLKHVTVGRFFLEDITFVVGSGWSAKTPLLLFELQSDDSIIKFEQDREFGDIWSKTASITPKIYLDGHTCNLRRMLSGPYTAQIMTAGTLGVLNGLEYAFTGSFADGLAPLTLNLYNGDLLLGSSGNSVTVPAGSSLNILRNSRIGIFGNQSFGSVSGETPEGGVSVAEGATLTVAGAAANTNRLAGTITGAGGIEVAGGAGYALELTGSSDYTGATRVRSGTLKTKRPKSVEDLVAYWNFEDGAVGRSVMDVSSVEPMTLTNLSDYAYFPSVVEGGAGGGRCARFVTDPDHLQSLFTASPRPERFYAISNSYSIVMYLKPDGRTMVEDAGKAGVEFYDERPNSFMHIFYNAWVNYGMNWVYFNGQRHIRFSGTGDGATADYTLAIPSDIDMFDGAWHQLAWTYDRNAHKTTIYIDGRLMSERTRTSDFSLNLASGLRFGAYAVNSEVNRQRGYDGDMDNIQLWSRAITSNEVAADWRRMGNISGDRTIAKPAPVAHWKFDDASDLGKDSSGNGFHLTAVKGSGSGVSAVPEGCPGVNGGAASLPTLVSSKGSHFVLETPAAPFPSGTQDFTITIRLMPRLLGDGASSSYFFFGGGAAADSVNFWQRNWAPYIAVTAYDWGCIDDGNQAATDYNYGYFHLSGANASNRGRSYWFTVAFSHDHANRRMKIYRDGVLVKLWSYTVNDSPHSGVGDTPSFYLGYSPLGGKWFPEYVDDCRVYDRALSDGEVAEISRELCNGDATVTDEVLPATTAVTVDSGATLRLGANQTLASISGAGTVDLFGADLTLTGSSSFSGALKGGGDISAPSGSSLALSGDGSGYRGRILSAGGKVSASPSYSAEVAVAEGTSFSVAADGTGAPLVSAKGKVTLPSAMTISFTGSVSGASQFTLFDGGEVVLPTDISGWTVNCPQDAKARILVKDGKVLARVNVAGLTIVVE